MGNYFRKCHCYSNSVESGAGLQVDIQKAALQGGWRVIVSIEAGVSLLAEAGGSLLAEAGGLLLSEAGGSFIYFWREVGEH